MPDAKIVNYLLSDAHPEGRFKARFFRQHGFDDPASLAEALRNIARGGRVTIQLATDFGQIYVVDGEAETPRGISVPLRTVWIREHGSAVPRLVTAYPR